MKKNSFLKCFSILATGSVAFATMNGTAANATDHSSEQSEEAIIAELLSEFGFDTMEDLLGSSRTLPDVSHIKDLNDDGVANAADSQFILQFLNGQRMYYYEYNELDVTGDCILNSADAQAYLQYYGYHRLYSPTVPFSAHGSLRTVDNTFENRFYWRYDCTTQTKDTDPYPVSTSNCYSPFSNELNELQVPSSSKNLRSFTGTEDQRFVTVHTASGIGTGFIIGEHLIATAAHCVYHRDNRNSGYFTFSSVKRYNYAYDNSGNITATTAVNLTPLSVHVPVAYDSAAIDNDYALIVVSEDLSTYGYCNLGMIIDGVDILYLYSSGDVDYVDDSGAEIKLMGYAPSGSYNPPIGSLYLPGTSYGELFNYNSTRFTTTSDYASGASGGAFFIKDCTNYCNTAFGIFTSRATDYSNISPNGYLSRGVLITRPILQFFYFNPTITY